MPEALTLTQQCDRLVELTGEMRKIIYADDGSTRAYTDDEGQRFDTLSTEAAQLKAAIASHKASAHRLETMEEMEEALDQPRPRAVTIDDLETQNQQARTEFSHGRYRLRNFKGPRAHEMAYHAGLVILARCGNQAVQEWALARCKDRQLNVQQLAPYQGEDGNSSGGYLVFPEFEARLIDLKEQYGVLQRNAYRMPMGSNTLTIPRRCGGITVYYPDEHGEITASAMKFDNITLVAKKYAALTRMSNELSEDSVIAMADILTGEMAYAFSKAEDTNGFIGDGTSTYAGTVGLLFKLINAVNGVTPSGSVKGAISGNTTVATLDLADFEATIGILPLYAEARAKWYMSKSAFWAGPARLIDAAGGNTSQMLAAGAPPRFLGYDVEFCQVMPTSSTATGASATAAVSIPALLGDLSLASYLGVRRGVSVQASDQRYFENDQVGIRATQRVAVNNAVGDAEAPTSAAGPVVALQLASA